MLSGSNTAGTVSFYDEKATTVDFFLTLDYSWLREEPWPETIPRTASAIQIAQDEVIANGPYRPF